MASERIPTFSEEERAVYSLISVKDGIKAKDIASLLHLSRSSVNHLLFSSPLMHELCFQDSLYCWHALIRQAPVHEGLYEFSGWYGLVKEFLAQSEEEWLAVLEDGCRRIGRNLNDTRGLIHSFLDCRKTMRSLFDDLRDMADFPADSWEIVFELRFNLMRRIRIYADVLVITPDKVFPLEFKMKNRIEPEEVLQAAKYVPYLEILFGREKDIYPALVLTGTSELFTYEPIGKTEYVLPVCSGDMLFNVFNEAMGFLG